ncbi:nucleoside hydrolase [Brumicola pallidula]|uniref:Probable uridine nucleosidase 2 n=1 Tax=Brumicola pallidula DSM 14239 = ACAM 615 TaxID=1121922 RepID=K6ZAL7_9ALTE|nr:nucleoside hydrolase [Glaciecola pallidula]GAC27387.1 probable uridine nucleosidase 2 [Glaciecola pallidula DSM 14239 = ACAM 615]
MKKKVIFDTDPGIDDAMAILFAQASGKIDLLGITTVFGNATIENATRNALYLKQRFSIPAIVCKGAKDPLIIPAGEPTTFVHGQNGLGDIELPDSLSVNADPRIACDFIIETVRNHPSEVTIVAVGRLTNLALAIQKAPDIIALVKEVVVMGGAFGHNGHTGNVSPYAEANIIGDPHAADLVFTQQWPVTVVGLDVTQQSIMNDAYIQKLKEQSDVYGDFIYQISHFYSNFHKQSVGLDGFYVHDSSAVAYVLAPELFKIQQGPIRVVCEGPAMGMTLCKTLEKAFPVDGWQDKPSQQVCIDVDSQGLLDLYFNILRN